MRHTAWILGGILILAAFLRFFLLHEIPPGLYPDEAANGVDALGALDHADFRVFYAVNNGREGLFIDLQALSIQMFGPTAWALRAVSAAAGTLTVLFLYLLALEIGRRIFFFKGASRERSLRGDETRPDPTTAEATGSLGWARPSPEPEGGADSRGTSPQPDRERDATVFALLAAFLLAVSFWHLNFSRIGFRAILLPLFSSAGFYLLLYAIRTRALWSFAAAGFSHALALNTYIASRILPPIVLGIFLADIARAGRKRVLLLPWGLFALFFAVAILPLAGYFIAHPADFTGRAGDVSVFTTDHPIRELAESAAKTLGMFHVSGDTNWRHNVAGAPQLDVFTGFFFLIGIGALILWLRRFPQRLIAIFLLVWWFAMLTPAIATSEGLPHALRSLGAIPPTILIAALGATTLWMRAGSRLSQHLRVGAASLALVFVLLANTYQYFNVWAADPNVSGAFRQDLVQIADYLKTQEDALRFVIVNEGGVLLDGIPIPAATVRYLTADDPEIRYLTPERILEITPEFDRTRIVLTSPPSSELDISLRALFPSIERAEESGIIVYNL